MTDSEIEKFIDSNNNEKLSFYLANLLSKNREIEKENNKLGIMMLILILLFYLIDTTNAEILNIGPISMKDFSTIKIFIPLVFAFLILKYIIINSHKAELIRIVKKFSNRFFNYDNTNIDVLFTDDFTRILLPISIYEEFNKFSFKETSTFGCLGGVILFPLIIGLLIAPFYFEYIWLKPMLQNYSNINYFEKASIICTIWILLVSLYYLSLKL
jgi:hypothetical protein